MSKQTDFRQLYQRLEELIAWFESSEIDLDEAVGKYEEGMKLINQLYEQLDAKEAKITELTQAYGDGVADDGNSEGSDKDA